ncbi:MAG: DUF1786 family protein [Dehalococcoidales bacterium]|nr:DUF1786 family protein [Dehalococcoidales bacterium]
MRILAVDIGTGTQDVLLFDSSQLVENCVQMIMPSPTRIIAGRINQATAKGRSVFLSGVTMGGGPNNGALARHLATGLAAYATEAAALTFNDNLEAVRAMGVTILAGDEKPPLGEFEFIELKDLDLVAIRQAFQAFGVEGEFDAVAVAVLDHGFSPDMSNRLFRFDHLRRVVSKTGALVDFCYLAGEVPDYLTRAKALAGSVGDETPLLFTDTGVAAVLGSLQDREVLKHKNLVLVNLGNSHTIAFHLVDRVIKGLFEHHTPSLNATVLDSLVTQLARGALSNEEIYENGGHGALIIEDEKENPFLAVTGPRQDVVSGSSLDLHKAVPYGDIMLTGCYGLVKACAMRMENWREEIERTLALTS